MKRNWSCLLVSTAIGTLLSIAPVALALAQSGSGFLKDYSQLEVKKDSKGVERRIWISDKADWKNYQQMMIDPVEFHPKPEGTAQVSLGTLTDIRNYLNASIPKAVAAQMPVANAAGPGVLRLRLAITAVSVDKSLKPYQLIPLAFVVTAAKRGSGTAAYNVKLQVESELLDSDSGEVLARTVREASGVEVKGNEPVTLKTAQPQIDRWLVAFQEEIALRAKKPAP